MQKSIFSSLSCIFAAERRKSEMSNEITQHHGYKNWAEFITAKIKLAQTQTAFKVNSGLLTLYWEIGNSILEKQSQNGWGSKVIDLLASDLAKNFPDNSGFSVRNLKYMRAFAEAYPQFPIVQVALAQITWYHHISLLAKVKDSTERAFYIAETAKNEWSRDVMLLHIHSKLYERDGKALNNFELKVEYAMRGLTKPLGVASYELEQLVKENIDKLDRLDNEKERK